jgi:hypothetical protein
MRPSKTPHQDDRNASKDRELTFAYLLGEISETERDDFEDRFLADRDSFEIVQAAEDELIDEYVFGRLSGARRRRFEERFLRTEVQRRRVELARRLGSSAAAMHSPVTRWPALFEPVRRNVSAAAFATAVLVFALALFAIGWWTIHGVLVPNQLAPIRENAVQVHGTSLAYVLAAGTTPDVVSRNTFHIPPDSEDIRLSAEVNPGFCRVCLAEIRATNSTILFLGLQAMSSGRIAKLDSPIPRLEPGDYVLTLREATKSVEYGFRIRFRIK